MRAYLLVAVVRTRLGVLQAVTVTEVSASELRPWHAAEVHKLRAAHPNAALIRTQSKDITDWVEAAHLEIEAAI